MKKLFAAVALAVAASSSYAGTPGTLYAGLDVGSTKIDDVPDRESSFGAFVGYNFHQNFALEAGYRRLASWNVLSTDLTVDQISLSAIGSVPLNQGFSLYGRLGYNRLQADSSFGDESESGVLYGIGLSYNFSPTIAARLEWQKPSSDSTNVSVGVAFQF